MVYDENGNVEFSYYLSTPQLPVSSDYTETISMIDYYNYDQVDLEYVDGQLVTDLSNYENAKLEQKCNNLRHLAYCVGSGFADMTVVDLAFCGGTGFFLCFLNEALNCLVAGCV